MRYKWSNYNYFVFNDNNFVCYNTKSGAVSFGETKLFDSKCIDEDANKLVDHTFFPFFLQNGFIVSEDTNELYQLKELNKNKDIHTLHVTLVPTLDCNFACPYCYQKGTHSNYYMTSELTQGVLKFIREKCLNNPINSIQLTWFGGEPTLSLDFIEEFMSNLTTLSDDTTGFTTTTTIVTNGYLLTPEVFERLYKSYVRIFQITLDGEEDNHDRYRVLVDGTKTFQTIYNNLLAIKRLMPRDYEFLIQIRANFFKDNIISMQSLLESYSKDFNDDKRFSVCFRPILDFTGDFKKDVASKFEARKMEASMINYMKSQDVDIDENNRMFTLLPMPVSHWCKSSEIFRYVINYDGSVYCCNSAMTNSNHCVGHLESDGRMTINEDSVNQWDSSPFKDLSSSCLKCKKLPVCMGGCAKERIEFGKVPCHWTDTYINNILNNLLLSI